MSETYIVTAKTVELAIKKANEQYADESHEISYEIMEMPKRGIFGIGAKDAKLKVNVTKIHSVTLDSLVDDIKHMKVFTDKRGDEENKPKNTPKDEKKNLQNSSDRNQNNQHKDIRKDKNNNNKKHKGNEGKQEQRQNGKPAQKPEKPAAEQKPAEIKEEKPKTKLNNQALPGKRNKQFKATGSENSVETASVTINQPANLNDFEGEKKSESTFGSYKAASGGKISNDVKRNKKPQVKPESTDKAADIVVIKESAKSAEKVTEIPVAEPVVSPVIKEKEAVSKEEMKYALDFANTLLVNMGLSAKAEAAEKPDGETLIVTETETEYPKINITGEEASAIIGHHGETLDAVQYLVNLSAIRKTKSSDGDYVKIVVDAGDYRQKREATLRALARRMAAKAVKNKRNVYLEPMNAYERRIIHSELQSYQDVSTHSVGSDKDRKIVVTYEGPGKNRKGGFRGDDVQTTDTVIADIPRRTHKIQKLPIDKLTDYLDGNETVTVTVEEQENE